jgi:enediyne polyketide synthase
VADPYVEDHVLQKQRLFPAVMGLEAMAQAAMALTGRATPPSFEEVTLTRPVAIGDRAITCIRLAALRRAPDLVEVCLRSQETDFHVDHFRALCRFGVGELPRGLSMRTAVGCEALGNPCTQTPLELEPARDLYGRLLFHRGRFARVGGYRLLEARDCLAELTPDHGAPWFGPYLPGGFVLGDAGARDAALHAIQASIPHRRLLPTGIDRLVLRSASTVPRFARARERSRNGANFLYDVEISNAAGEVVESWEGLHLRAVEPIEPPAAWPEALLAPYWERRLEELAPDSHVHVVLQRGPRARAASDAAMQRALGGPDFVWRRPDGKPVVNSERGVSAAHAGELTVAVAGPPATACDLETVNERSADAWRALLGQEQFQLAGRLAEEQGEPTDIAGTRLWTALECIKKAGLSTASRLVLDLATPDGWVLLRSGGHIVATFPLRVRDLQTPVVFSVLVSAVRHAEKPVPKAAGALA